MKILTFLSFLFSFSTFSFTEMEKRADQLFLNRSYKNQHNGRSQKSALEAADLFWAAAKKATKTIDIVRLSNKALEALYFHGTQMPNENRKDKKAKLKIYWDAHLKGVQVAAMMVKGPKNPLDGNIKEEKFRKPLALTYFWTAAIMARWGELKGPFSALTKWRKLLKPTLISILKLAPETFNHGVYRILGKALMVLRTTVEGKSGLEFIKIGYKPWRVGTGEYPDLTKNPTTSLYYIQILKNSKGEENLAQFCKMYEQFSDLADTYKEEGIQVVEDFFGPSTEQGHYVPEALMEINDLSNDKKLAKHFYENC